MKFIPALHPSNDGIRPRWWFLFRDDKILIQKEDEASVRPYLTDLPDPEPNLVHRQYLGALDGTGCFAAELPPEAPVPAGAQFHGIRYLFGLIDEEILWIAGRANQLVHWAQTHQFCGRCGQPTRDKPDERAKICAACGLINYPRVSPAIIVAVIKDNSILLAHANRFQPAFFSVLAGFVEPGETLEECVRREVHEEVGITVKNIRYFGSQPWPFPNSLMVAFTAQYAGGEIAVDRSEIVTADWFAPGKVPRVPIKLSIARRLIDWFVENHR